MSYYLWRRLHDWVMRVLQPEPVPMEMQSPDRAELFVHLHTLRERRAGEAEQHERSVEELEQALIPAQAAVDSMRRTLADLHADQFCKSMDASAEEDRLLRLITEKSSLSVQLFIEELDAELSVLQRTEANVLPSAHRDYVIGKKTMGLETNGPSRKRRAVALNAARQRAESMRLEPLTIEQMNTELIRLRRSLPAVEHEVIHGERAAIVAHV
jgi:hypothetical protein